MQHPKKTDGKLRSIEILDSKLNDNLVDALERENIQEYHYKVIKQRKEKEIKKLFYKR